MAIQKEVLSPISGKKIAPIRVKLISKAVAKSHRPTSLFSKATCPIIGNGALGELFVKATPEGLNKLERQIEQSRAKRTIKELSCIESIEAVTPVFRKKGMDAEEIIKHSPRREEAYVTRVKLFRLGTNDEDQKELEKEFLENCETNHIDLSSGGYERQNYTYAAMCHSASEVELLSEMVAVRSISGMPQVGCQTPISIPCAPLTELPSCSEENSDIPVVVVVDSGVSDKIPPLNSWVVGRDRQVPRAYRNPEHGTFVAGLVCWGKLLNPELSGQNAEPCGVFDLQVLPNDNPKYGRTSALLESELLISLDEALKKYAGKYKVWNLSLGTSSLCSLEEFSALAVELDNLQEKYQVSFVVSAGNYITKPLLDYPRTAEQIEAGRITSPADTVLGITVGSVSHVGFKNNGPAINCPSAFSRHGAGPNFIIKPDLVHYGGACTVDARQTKGIRSVTEAGFEEKLGTSFSAPLVSRTLAQIYHQIVTPAPSPVLARALLTHHARDPRSGGRVPDREENYIGFGLPSSVPECLGCTQHEATLIFTDTLRPGFSMEWDDFPFPPSLQRGGRYFGHIWMTLAFAPARGDRWGTEYCESHIDAHLGVYRKRKVRKTGEIVTDFKGLVPPEFRDPEIIPYETYQVKELRKWAPVRTYFGDLGENGERGSRWRLKLQLLTRHGNEMGEPAKKPQPFALIVTIADPNNTAPVYDEIVQLLRSRFQTQNLAIRAQAKARGVV